MCSADAFIILDDVQFVKREFKNRCKCRFLKKPEKEFWINM
ncbi:WbqC family protein [Alkaliphilus peptidifermentans]